MFDDTKYSRAYYAIIGRARLQTRRKGEGRYDRHHIVPTSLGGPNTQENVVLLTLREHYICHLLLLRMTSGRNRSKMAYAFFRFRPKGAGVTSSRAYERFVRSASVALHGAGNAFFGRTHSVESRQRISQNHGMRGRGCHDVWVEKYGREEADARRDRMIQKRSETLTGAGNPQFGRQRTSEQKRAQSDRMTGSKHPLFGSRFAWINRKGQSKRAPLDELEAFLQAGWSRGRAVSRAAR